MRYWSKATAPFVRGVLCKSSWEEAPVRPRSRCRGYISALAWEHLEIHQPVLVDVARESEVWGSLLKLQPPWWQIKCFFLSHFFSPLIDTIRLWRHRIKRLRSPKGSSVANAPLCSGLNGGTTQKPAPSRHLHINPCCLHNIHAIIIILPRQPIVPVGNVCTFP